MSDMAKREKWWTKRLHGMASVSSINSGSYTLDRRQNIMIMIIA